MRGEANHVRSGCFLCKERRRYGARRGRQRATAGRIHSVMAIASPCSLAREWSWLLRSGGGGRWKVRASLGRSWVKKIRALVRGARGGVDWELEKN